MCVGAGRIVSLFDLNQRRLTAGDYGFSKETLKWSGYMAGEQVDSVEAGSGEALQSCEEFMLEMFHNVLSCAVSKGWPEALAAYFLAEAADQHIHDLWKSRSEAKNGHTTTK